ncbi:binding-protein-dependent transport systems inner membrane component [Ignisphaera aggregans DSM 17230]|uniref:Binding-protein-dependent transport systems inner membrane component n=1 Tax=Ignisphaera aggregans (strain DSM 17230 / JCM 13409 / AQ1.S1) TaxID=583356 RepID=E0SQ17_IGNAA|nr:binding-protein-dependent transport systems inner membrane component [Ignisphaera aggregans DSM 17230]
MRQRIYRYFIKVLSSFLLFILFISILYISIRVIPGDPITALYGETRPDPNVRSSLEKMLGLDKPLYIQILSYISRVFRGDLGRSIYYGIPVSVLIINRLFSSAILATVSTIVMILLCISAIYLEFVLRRYRNVLKVISALSASMPTLGWGSLLIAISIYLGIPIGFGSIVGPLITLSIVGFGFFYRYLRASIINIFNEHYIEFYHTMGFSQQRIVFIAMRIALPKFLTALLYRAGLIMTSAIVVETLFQYPGMGSLFSLALQSRDYPVLIGWGVTAIAISIALYIAIDILHSVLDPRVGSYESLH